MSGRCRGRGGAWRRRWQRIRQAGEAGMSTAEYAVGTVAACAFAAVLYRIVRSQAVMGVLSDVITRALHTI